MELETQVGIGTTVLLRLPLTLAIIPSMIVGVGGQRFAIPQVNVVEFVWVRASDVRKRIERVHGAEVLRLRDQLLPLVRLADILGLERTYLEADSGSRRPDRRGTLMDRRSLDPGQEEPPPDAPTRGGDRRTDWRSDYNIVVLRLGSNQFGIVVDELYDIEEIVVKPLSEFIKGCKCFSGATILGDGRVIMILDAGGLVGQAGLHFADLQAEEKQRHEEEKRKAAAASLPQAVGDRVQGRRGRVLRHPPGPGHAAGEDPGLGHPGAGGPGVRGLPRTRAAADPAGAADRGEAHPPGAPGDLPGDPEGGGAWSGAGQGRNHHLRHHRPPSTSRWNWRT